METFTPADFFNDPKWTEEVDENKLTPMKEFFKDKTIFLTGGTGFLGQLYVEKLLRCDVKMIYLLGRAKRGKSAEERLKETFTGMHFMKLYNHDKDYLKRIKVIEGEMRKLNLGISESDEKDLLENVEIVLHAAADVRFDEKLRTLLLTNLRGTREILELTTRMKKIKVFSFISTAYSHCVKTVIEEKFYESPIDPEVMIELGEKYDANPHEELEITTERIIRPWPNTYTFTKALTEELVRRYGTKLPICIIRPSIVISTHEDPVPAWCNNIYGLNGALVACGLGILRVMPLQYDYVGDVVCADFVINSTLAVIWATYQDSLSGDFANQDPEIYHVCTSTDRPVTWGMIGQGMSECFEESPSSNTLWKQCTNPVTSDFWFKYLTIFYHVIPAVFTDIALKIGGKKLRVLPIYRKVQRFMVALTFFMRKNWRFDNSNMKRILNRMTPEDQDFFPSDVRRYNWSTFRYSYLSGLKVYIGLESLDDSAKAKRKYQMLVILHYLVLIIYYGLHIAVFKALADKLGVFQYVKNSMLDTYEFLKNPQLIQ